MNFSDPCSLAAPGGEIWIKYSCNGPQKPIETTINEGNIQVVSFFLSTDIQNFQKKEFQKRMKKHVFKMHFKTF